MSCFDAAWQWIGANASNIIALSAFGATMWGAYIARRHNRLSVTPHISTFIEYNTNDSGYEIKVKLQNNGVGPAKIQKFKVLLDDVALAAKSAKDIEEKLDELFPKQLTSRSATLLTQKYMMSAKEEKLILRLKFPQNVDCSEIDKTLERLSLIVDYKCIYGKSRTFDSREES